MKTRFTMTDRGFSAGLERHARQVPQFVGDALYAEGQEIMTDSKENYTPVDVGTLRDSGYVDDPDIRGGKVGVEIGYGGEAEDYAVVQHEDMSLHHTVGGPKFLEIPFNEHANGMDDRIAERVKRRL